MRTLVLIAFLTLTPVEEAPQDEAARPELPVIWHRTDGLPSGPAPITFEVKPK